MSGSTAVLMRDRRVPALLASAVLAVILAFVAIPDLAAIKFVSQCGYWFVLLGFAGFVYGVLATLQDNIRSTNWRAFDWATAVVIGLSGTILLVHEAYGFKIVMDEIMLLGTSMSMHLDKTVLTPMRGHDIQGAFVILDGMMDKRPLFFPFLVSTLHDLFGYRPENAFVLNSVLVFIFLTLVYRLGLKLAGRQAGWIGVVLFAGLPLLGHNATGGGFELLNLVMILSTLLLGVRYLERRDGASVTAFCFSALLLAQVRYESVVYFLPVVLILLWGWMLERRIVLSWPVVFAPLLLVHYPLQHRIFDLRTSAWELASQPGSTEPFSLQYVGTNVAHAIGFFFANAAEQPNSIVLSALGWIAVPFFALLLMKRSKTLRSEPPVNVASVFFAVGFVVQFLLLMCYFWGRFDDIVIRRLSLPTHLGLVLAVLAVLPQFGRPAVLRGLLGLAVFGVITRGVPSMASHAYSQEYLPGRETAWRRAFIKEQRRSDYLMIDNDSPLWIAHKVSATPVQQAQRRRDSIVFHLRNRTYSDVFVFQRLDIDPETGGMTLRAGDDLGPQFILEPVREERLQTLKVARISRLKEIRDGNTAISHPPATDKIVPADTREMERIRRIYLENFLKQLP